MDEFLKSNRELWNAWTRVHVNSKFYDVDGFKAGQSRLDKIELELGDVRGKSLLHLQCHFGLTTLSWARLGASVTGADFSDEAIAQARRLAESVGLKADFVCSDIEDLPNALSGQFDFVFTSHGVLGGLPDLPAWAGVIAHFLKPGGTFYIVEAHPTAFIFDEENPDDLRVRYPYFHSAAPGSAVVNGTYADRAADIHGVEYFWIFSMSDVLSALIGAGLHIVEMREYDYLAWQMYPFMKQDAEGWWRLPDKFPRLPLMFSLRSRKP